MIRRAFLVLSLLSLSLCTCGLYLVIQSTSFVALPSPSLALFGRLVAAGLLMGFGLIVVYAAFTLPDKKIPAPIPLFIEVQVSMNRVGYGLVGVALIVWSILILEGLSALP